MMTRSTEPSSSLPKIDDIVAASDTKLCYAFAEVDVREMTRGTHSSASQLADEAGRAAERADLPEDIRSLLQRCREALAPSAVPYDPCAALVRAELEGVACMIEAEGVVWPEDVERFRALAGRVRARLP